MILGAPIPDAQGRLESRNQGQRRNDEHLRVLGIIAMILDLARRSLRLGRASDTKFLRDDNGSFARDIGKAPSSLDLS